MHFFARRLLVCLALGLLFSTPAVRGAEVQELRVWIHKQDPGFLAAFRAFEAAHPGWRVIQSPYIGGADSQKLMTAIAGGDPPDVILQDRFTIGEWASRDALLPLDDLIARSHGRPDAINRDDFYAACWNEGVYDNRVYAIPYNTDARALYYNEELLKRAGLVDAEGNAKPPRDWEELKEYAAKLTERDAAGRITTLGFAPNYGNSWLYLYAWLNGGEMLSADGRTATMNSPQVVEALRYMGELYDVVGGVQKADEFISSSSGTAFDPFALGRVAMKIDGNFGLRAIVNSQPYLQFGVAPPPAPKGMKSVTWSGGFAYAIPATARHVDIAFELIQYMVSDEGWRLQNSVNARYFTSRGLPFVPELAAQPAINDAVMRDYVDNDPNMPPKIGDALPVFTNLMAVSRYRPVSPLGQLVWDKHVEAIEAVTRGGASPKVTLDRAVAVVQPRLDRIYDQTHGPRVPLLLVTSILLGVCGVVGAGAWIVAFRRGRRRHAYPSDQIAAGLFYVSPWLVGFLVLTAGPILASLIFAFCRYDVLHDAEWVGLANFRRLLFADEMFWRSLANTAYMLLGVPLGMALGLAIAMLLNAEVRGMKVYRTIFYLPTIVPMVASSILWVWVLNPSNGLVNSLLRLIGIADPPAWLNSPSWFLGSKASIILMGLWGAGGSMIIWLAGLKGIPRHLYEAAEIDGAGPVRSFWNVTLPMLTPYIFFNLIMGVIATMQIFTQAFVMTQGGPANSTMFYAYYLFNSAFRYFEMGYASALAWVLLLIILALTLVQMWSSRKWVHYEAA